MSNEESKGINKNSMSTKAGERHYKDINQTNYVADTTGTVTLINGVSTGSAATQRCGNKVFLDSVHITGRIRSISDLVIRTRCDLYVIWDKQPGAAVPNMTDFFVESVSGSPKNLDNRERFHVVLREFYCIGGKVAAGESKDPSIDIVDLHKELDLRTIYKGDGNAIGDISTGAMYLVTIGDQAAGAGGEFRVAVRLRFWEH